MMKAFLVGCLLSIASYARAELCYSIKDSKGHSVSAFLSAARQKGINLSVEVETDTVHGWIEASTDETYDVTVPNSDFRVCLYEVDGMTAKHATKRALKGRAALGPTLKSIFLGS